MAKNILANVNRCVGCWTCSLSCKEAYGLADDEYRVFIRTIGGGQIDTPGGKWPNLYMKWMPIYTKKCIGCAGNAATGGVPYCVFNCPTDALVYGDSDDPESAYSKTLAELKANEFRVYALDPWEEPRDGVFYAEKDI